MLAECIAEIARKENYDITCTIRDTVRNFQVDRTQLFLDIASTISINKFLQEIKDFRFERIISLIGKTSLGIENSDREALLSYYETYTLNLFYIIERLSSNHLLDHQSSQLTAIASRSAHHGSFDLHYAAVKGALVSFILSLGPKLEAPKTAISISPGLIIGSAMFDGMSVAVQRDHMNRSGGRLLDVKEAAAKIWSMSLLPLDDVESGRNYFLGPDYK